MTIYIKDRDYDNRRDLDTFLTRVLVNESYTSGDHTTYLPAKAVETMAGYFARLLEVLELPSDKVACILDVADSRVEVLPNTNETHFLSCDQPRRPQQRQDSTEDQLRTVMQLAVDAGCYDAADFIQQALTQNNAKAS